jgi:hypothetical protein
MKIEARCDTCARTFALSQAGPDAQTPGRCPFCGARFARHYTTVLMDIIPQAGSSADAFIHALSRIQAMDTGFDIDIKGLLAEVTRQLREHDQHSPAG